MNFELASMSLGLMADDATDLLLVLVPDGFKPGRDGLSRLIGEAMKSQALETKAGKLLSAWRAPGVAAQRLVLAGAGDMSAVQVRTAVVAAMALVKSAAGRRLSFLFGPIPPDISMTIAQLRTSLVALAFGATTLLAQTDAAVLPAREQALVLWARGLLHLRRREAAALDTLSQAVSTGLQRAADPATWPALALCACDHAVALHEAGHHEAARERIGQVWPVLEAHATVPLLRMLEADDLLPVRSTPNT